MNHSGNLRDLLYRPGIDESRYETMPFDPSAAPPAYETMPYYPDSQRDERASTRDPQMVLRLQPNSLASYPDEELRARNREYMEQLNNRRDSDYYASQKASSFLNDFLRSVGGLIGGSVAGSNSQNPIPQDPFAEIFQKSRETSDKPYEQFMTPCEKCRSMQDPNIMNIADPCRGVCGTSKAVETAGPSFDMLPDIDSPVIDRDIERYRQSPGYRPLDMNKFYRNLERVRQMLRGV